MTQKKKNSSGMRYCRCGIGILLLILLFIGRIGFIVYIVAFIVIAVIFSIVQKGKNKNINPNPAPNAAPQATYTPPPQPAVRKSPPAQLAPQISTPDTEVHFCPLCGKSISKNTKFCSVCGGKID